MQYVFEKFVVLTMNEHQNIYLTILFIFHLVIYTFDMSVLELEACFVFRHPFAVNYLLILLFYARINSRAIKSVVFVFSLTFI